MPATEHRKLAAIMFTDMVGYSALAQRDEALALELLEEHRRIVRGILPQHAGREVKTTGDGFLIEFPSALAAVQCAVDVQAALHARNLAQPEERQVRIRIGIHVGDVVVRDGDVHGDGVNLAARIEPLAGRGGICLSRQVHDQVANKLEAPLARLGRAELKNIEGGLEVYRVVLPWQRGTPGRIVSGGRRRWQAALLWAVAALGLVGGLWIAAQRRTNPDGSSTTARPILRRFELNLPTPGRAMIDGQEMHPVISPDGRKVAFANAEGLWLRRLDSVGPPVQLVAGGNISSPFWSPRSTEVGFFDGTKLMRVSVEGGRPESVAEVEGFSAQGGGGAAWLDDDRIFLTTGNSGLSVVPAHGGSVKPVWPLRPEDGISDLHQPSPLPGAVGGLVVVHRREENASALFGIDTLAVWKPTGEHQVIWQDPTSVVGRPVYCPSGHVLFQRGFETTEIWAVPFSLKNLARTDEAFRVADLGGAPSASADGTLLFLTMGAGTLLGPRQLVWVDQTGKLLDTLGQVLPALSSPVLSRDQHRIVAVAGKGPGDFNLWLTETAGGGALPLTRTNGFNIAPFWSADGRAVFFRRLFGPQVAQTLTLPVDGIGEEKLVLPFAAFPSPSGRYFLTEGDETKWVSASGWRYAEAGKTNLAPLPLARVFGSVNEPRFSPDERRLALSSPVSGRREVWVVDFPAVTNRIQISRSGGRSPVWHHRSGELFFLTLDGKSLMSARQKTDGEGFEEPRKLFDVPGTVWTGTIYMPAYDVAADGERFLMLRRAEESVSTNAPARPNAMLVENWFEEFREKK